MEILPNKIYPIGTKFIYNNYMKCIIVNYNSGYYQCKILNDCSFKNISWIPGYIVSFDDKSMNNKHVISINDINSKSPQWL